jgi:lycopene cyclase domain-containing protein
MRKHLRYIGTFFVVCVVPTMLLTARMPLEKVLLLFGIFLFSVVFFVLGDIGLTKSERVPGKWAYHFNPQAIVGVWIYGLPFEEYIFIFITIFLPISFWEFIKAASFSPSLNIAIGVLALLLLIVVSPIMHHLDV